MKPLPDVIVQIICQMLSTTEIIQIAKCSRQMMHAADNPVAWAGSILRVSSSKLPPVALSSLRLLRHARVSLTWPFPHQHRFFERDLEATLDIFTPSLTELDFTGCIVVGGGSAFFAITSTVLHRVLTHPCAKHLRALHIHRNVAGAITEQTARSLCKLPQLDTLSVMQFGEDHSGWRHLVHARKLTCLSFGMQSTPSTSLGSIATLQLRELRLTSAELASPGRAGAFLRFFSGPQMSRLQVLTLSCCRVYSSPPHAPNFQTALADHAEHVAAFREMKLLRVLHLESMPFDSFLPAVKHAPALQLVTILPAKSYWGPPTLPLLPVVCDLLALCPQLHVAFLHDMPYSATPRGPLTIAQQLRLCYPQVSDGTMDHAILLAERIRFQRRPIDFEIDYGHP